MRILLAEDDAELAERLKKVLVEAGFTVDIAADGTLAEYLGQTEAYDAVVLDLGLPGMNGVSVLQRWREDGLDMPVLILTARGRWSEKQAGFHAGADDYMTKPFEMGEVVLRLHALIRRASGHAAADLRCGSLVLDTRAGRFRIDGAGLDLTAQEYRLLAYLMHNQGRVVGRSEIVEHVYERDADPDSNVVDVLLARIRRKLDRPLIRTVRGRGWVLEAGAS